MEDSLNNSRPIDVRFFVHLLLLFVTFLTVPVQLVGQESNNPIDYTNPFEYFSEEDYFNHLNYFRSKEAYASGDHILALAALQPLAEEGYDMPQALLGVMNEEGYGIVQNYDVALYWYRLSAMQGNAHAQFRLAGMYQEGYGVIKDNVLAHMWSNIASANSHFFASHQRDEIATSRMTPSDISKAQKMARDCMSSGYQNCGY